MGHRNTDISVARPLEALKWPAVALSAVLGFLAMPAVRFDGAPEDLDTRGTARRNTQSGGDTLAKMNAREAAAIAAIKRLQADHHIKQLGALLGKELDEAKTSNVAALSEAMHATDSFISLHRKYILAKLPRAPIQSDDVITPSETDLAVMIRRLNLLSNSRWLWQGVAEGIYLDISRPR